jgi:HK97 family phage portal protein
MDFVEARNGAARDIALAFGVPPMLLGIPGDNTYSNYQEANRVFWRQSVLPLAARVIASLGTWLTHGMDGRTRLDFDRDAVDGLNPDREALWKRVGEAGFLTRDEKRAAVGYGPLGGSNNSDGEG